MVSALILAVCFLVLLPFSPVSVASATSVSAFSHSWSSSWNPSFTFTHRSDGTWTGFTGSDPSFTYSHSFTFSHSFTYTMHSHSAYTSTEYVPAPIQNQWCDPSDPYCNGYGQYPCYPGYPGYPYACYPSAPSYPYQYPTTTTATSTSYLSVTQTSVTTSTATSISTPQPVFVTNMLTVTTATTNTTMETVYGTLMLVFLALFLASLFLLMNARSRTTNNPPPTTQQTYTTPN